MPANTFDNGVAIMHFSPVSRLIVYLMAIPIAYVCLSFWYLKYRHEKKLSAAVIFNSFWAVAAGILLVIVISFDPNPKNLTQALLASLGGACLGWLLGIYISPLGQSEAKVFEKYGTALAGILSGYTLKSAVELVRDHHETMAIYWLPIALFCICTLLSMAAVYNTRAYNSCLEVHKKGDKPEILDGAIKVPLSSTTVFYAQVAGPSDPAVRWSVYPPNDNVYRVDQVTGALETFALAAKCKLVATNLEDPRLSNFVNLDISA